MNSTIYWEFTFTGAFFLMFLIISIFVITLSTSVRILIKFIANKEITYQKAFGLRFYLDIQAALAFALGDAFFIGTEPTGTYIYHLYSIYVIYSIYIVLEYIYYILYINYIYG